MSRFAVSSDRVFAARPQRRRSRDSDGGLWLLLVDLGLLAILVVVPLVMGGRQAWGQLVFALLSCAIAACWSLHQLTGDRPGYRLTGAEPWLLGGVSLVLLQCWELPGRMVQKLSPHIGRLLPGWHSSLADTGTGSLMNRDWPTISLTPADTLSNLTQVIAGALLLVVVAQRIRTSRDVRRLLGAICAAAVLMAVFGLVQLLTSNGKFFWLYEHPFSHTHYFAKGAFTNKNHFASFLAMSLPLFIWWLTTSGSTGSRSSYGATRSRVTFRIGPSAMALAMGVVSVALLLSQSRGGLIAAIAGSSVTLVLMRIKGLLTGRVFGAVSCVAVLAVVSLACFGEHVERLAERSFADLTSGDIDQMDRSQARRRIWAAVGRGIAQSPILGTGLGSHREVYWTYFPHADDGKEYTHAENGYLQVALETGFLGLSLAGLTILCVLAWCRRGFARAPTGDLSGAAAAVSGALTVSIIHSLGDFVWYVPACMGMVMLLAGSAAGLARLTRPDTRPTDRSPLRWFSPTRLSWGATAMGAVLLGVWVVRTKAPEVTAERLWHEYVRLDQLMDSPDAIIDRDELRNQRLALVLSAADANPRDARLQLRAARACESLFRIRQELDPDRMPLSHIREAARVAEFTSASEMNEWLDRPGVLGEERRYLEKSAAHARRALALCPLLGSAYVQLAELVWLEGARPAIENGLLRQALRVRPYDPHVNFVVGREGWRRGETDAALRYWKVAFQRDTDYQQEIIHVLAAIFPAQQMLDEFDPDSDALIRLKDAYAQADQVEHSQRIAEVLAQRWSEQATLSPAESASALWCQVSSLQLELGNEHAAGQAAQAAVDANPNSFAARSRLGNWLFRQERYKEAREHLVWCSRRRPDDATLQQQALMATREAQRGTIQRASHVAPGPRDR